VALKVDIEDKAGIKAHYRRHASSTRLTKATTNDSTMASLAAECGLPKLKYGTVQDLVPEGWKLVSDDGMGTLYAGNVSGARSSCLSSKIHSSLQMAYMSPNVNLFSASNMTDGLVDVITIDGDLSPVTALRVMSQTDSPRFFDHPYVKYRKVSAYRITPRNQDDGCISIDGERIPFGPFQAEVHQGLGRVISKSGNTKLKGRQTGTTPR
jgi:sphingosine kinase